MNQRGLVLWVAAFAGVVLVYAAYKGKSPLSVIKTGLANNTGPTKKTGQALAAAAVTTGNTSGVGGVGSGGSIDRPSASLTDVTNDGTAYYSTDRYGNEVSLLPPAYQTSPATFVNRSA